MRNIYTTDLVSVISNILQSFAALEDCGTLRPTANILELGWTAKEISLLRKLSSDNDVKGLSLLTLPEKL
jgi:hypothetical protein